MSQNEEKNVRGGIQVITRAASILRTLKDSPTAMSLGQIAEQVGLPRSTVQRITGALAKENMVVTDHQGRGLRLGPEITSLASAATFNIVEHCRLLLTELTEKTGETTDLAAMRGGSMVFLDQVPGTHRLTTISRVGEAFPLSTTANGRACLADLPMEMARQLVEEEWAREGISSSMDKLLETLADVRKTGLAYDHDEHSSGISAIGFSFRDWGQRLHAISVPIPTTRFGASRTDIETALHETALSIRNSFA